MRYGFENEWWRQYVGDPRPIPEIIADKFDFNLGWHTIDHEKLYDVQDWLKGLCGVDDAAAHELRLKWCGLTDEKLADIPGHYQEHVFPRSVTTETLFCRLLFELNYETGALDAAREYALSALRQTEAMRQRGATADGPVFINVPDQWKSLVGVPRWRMMARAGYSKRPLAVFLNEWGAPLYSAQDWVGLCTIGLPPLSERIWHQLITVHPELLSLIRHVGDNDSADFVEASTLNHISSLLAEDSLPYRSVFDYVASFDSQFFPHT